MLKLYHLFWITAMKIIKKERQQRKNLYICTLSNNDTLIMSYNTIIGFTLSRGYRVSLSYLEGGNKRFYEVCLKESVTYVTDRKYSRTTSRHSGSFSPQKEIPETVFRLLLPIMYHGLPFVFLSEVILIESIVSPL